MDEAHEISREALEALIAKLRHGDGRMSINEAARLCTEAGLGDTWLYACCMYESEDMIWQAWRESTPVVK